ncbi:hypothetical protein MASR2M44_15260 [Bacteroidota bacterium]
MAIPFDLLGPDGGPIYSETNFSNFVVEPFNAGSAVLFMGISLYWIWKLWPSKLQFGFVFFASCLMLIGGLGGSLYHGFRWSKWFLLMDWLPITVLCILASVYFLNKLFHQLYYALFAMGTALLIQWLIWEYAGKHDGHHHTTLNYALLAISILLPVIYYLRKNHFRNGKWVAYALISFLLALCFRLIDAYEFLPFGTHFLWHIGGAIASHSMLQFMYLENDLFVSTQNLKS